MKKIFLSLSIFIAISFAGKSQNSSPYWSLAGNSNATSGSKLGTTNLVPLKFYTSNKQRMIIDSLGRVGINTNYPVNILTVKSSGGIPAASWLNGLNKPVFIGFADDMSSEFVLAGASNNKDERAVFQGRRSRGTLVSPLRVADNDYITSLLASAYDGTTFQNPALVSFFVDGTPSSGHVPARISLVTGTNLSDRTERLKVGSTGNFDFNSGQIFLRQSDGFVGIGTTSPGNTLHVSKGSSGGTGYFDAPLIVENSSHSYINILTQASNESGILFGNSNTNVAGGIIYNNYFNLEGLQFRVNGNQTGMVLSNAGNLGVGTFTPGSYKEKVSHTNFGFDIENSSTADDWEQVTFVTLQLYFNGAFRGSFNNTTGAYTAASDERLKTNIKPMTTMLEKINQLKPSTYQFKNTTDKQEYNGFIAQDVMKIFPAMVTHNVSKERSLDVYTLDYSGFGVLAVKGIQELEPVIEEQKKINEEQKVTILELEDRLNKLEAVIVQLTQKGQGAVATTKDAFLEQNNPNPVTANTIIRYQVPLTATSAKVIITDAKGQTIKTITISNKGAGQLSLNNGTLAAGVYNYTLYVNNKQIDSRQMVITN